MVFYCLIVKGLLIWVFLEVVNIDINIESNYLVNIFVIVVNFKKRFNIFIVMNVVNENL